MNSQGVSFNPGDFIRRFLTDIIEVFGNPQVDPEKTILILIIAGIALVVVVMVAWLLISMLTGRNNKPEDYFEEKHSQASRKEIWVGRAVLMGLMLASLVSVYAFGTQPSVCARCHDDGISKSVEKSAHKNISCASCHRSPGVGGHFVQAIDYTRWLVKFTLADEKGPKEPYDVIVDDAACLSCHSKVAVQTVTKWSIRVRHRDFLEKGAKCTECHSGVAHGKALRNPQEPTMSKCILCHDGKKASAKCDLCHSSTASSTSRKIPEEIIRFETMPMQNCRGCHTQDETSICIRCHGLELPHPSEWTRKAASGDRSNNHAKQGFINKQMCKKCHRFNEKMLPQAHAEDQIYMKEIFCNECHSYTSPHVSVERWLKMHGPEALKQADSDNPNCGKCHPQNHERKCNKCHSPDLCSSCHDDGRQEVIAPD